MPETKVQKKLNKLIQQELSDLLRMEHAYTPGVMLTVSGVRITADFSLAKVFITVFPDQKLEEAVKELNKNSWEVRRSLAARIRNKIRKIPELDFQEDDSFKEADRISRLLDTLDIPEESEDEEKGE
ncbi:MAG: 30S ribosome-binding factor RbfA [Bacteroidota bacterium]